MKPSSNIHNKLTNHIICSVKAFVIIHPQPHCTQQKTLFFNFQFRFLFFSFHFVVLLSFQTTLMVFLIPFPFFPLLFHKYYKWNILLINTLAVSPVFWVTSLTVTWKTNTLCKFLLVEEVSNSWILTSATLLS